MITRGTDAPALMAAARARTAPNAAARVTILLMVLLLSLRGLAN
jgi:hypothetical protein